MFLGYNLINDITMEGNEVGINATIFDGSTNIFGLSFEDKTLSKLTIYRPLEMFHLCSKKSWITFPKKMNYNISHSHSSVGNETIKIIPTI
jgi:hypothetical protein